MLDISRSERHLVLILLFSATLLLSFFYFQKENPVYEIKTIEFQDNAPLININIAIEEELERLPGIGPVLAEEIIFYRQRAGGFKDIEKIKNVKGIGNKKFEQIKDLISIKE